MKAPGCVPCFAAVYAASPLARRRQRGGRGEASPSFGLSFALRKTSSFTSESPSAASTAASDNDEASDSTLADVSPAEWALAMALLGSVEADPRLLVAAKRHRGGESLRALCVRFARARPQGHAEALEFLVADLQYRDECGVAALARTPLLEVLSGGSRGLPAGVEELYCEQLPHGILGFDKSGQAVTYRSLGSMRLWELAQQGVSLEAVVRQHQWVNERCLEAMGHRGRWVQIIDAQGVGLVQCTARVHLQFCRMLATLDAAHYPERLGQVFVINAPPAIAGTFKLVSSWLPEKTRERVRLLGGPEQWRGPISDCMDLNILPRHLGGEVALSMQGAASPARSGMERAVERGAATSALAEPCTFQGDGLSAQPSLPSRASCARVAVFVFMALLFAAGALKAMADAPPAGLLKG